MNPQKRDGDSFERGCTDKTNEVIINEIAYLFLVIFITLSRNMKETLVLNVRSEGH